MHSLNCAQNKGALFEKGEVGFLPALDITVIKSRPFGNVFGEK